MKLMILISCLLLSSSVNAAFYSSGKDCGLVSDFLNNCEYGGE